jgi:hypothetical protein
MPGAPGTQIRGKILESEGVRPVRGRLGLLIGFGAGYVFGAKAGRERYEQLNRLYSNLTNTPAFQRARGKAKDRVGTRMEQAKGKAAQGVSRVTESMRGRVAGGEGQPGGLSAAPGPTNHPR